MLMAGGSAAPTVDQLRAFAGARVEARGLRFVAREVGVEPNGLKYFLAGGVPRSTTRRKYEDWYLRITAATGEGTQGDTEAIALSVLVRDVPPAGREDAFRRAVAFYQQLYDELELPRPRWLQRLVKG
jgi:hypothetical protein